MLEPGWLYRQDDDEHNMPRLLDYLNLESLLHRMNYSKADIEAHFAELAIACRRWHERKYGRLPRVQDWEFWLDDAPPNYEVFYEQDTCYEYHPDDCTNLSPMWVAVYEPTIELISFIGAWMLSKGVSLPGGD